MSGRCKVTDCTDGPARGYGWCPTHRANWKQHGTPTPEVKAVAARRKVDPVPVPVLMPGPVVVDLTPAPAAVGHRCGSCGLVFPLLVDAVLCIRCDSLHYPALHYPAAVAS